MENILQTLYIISAFGTVLGLALGGWVALIQHKHKRTDERAQEAHDRIDSHVEATRDRFTNYYSKLDAIKEALDSEREQRKDAIWQERLLMAEKYASKSELTDAMAKVYADLETLRKELGLVHETQNKHGMLLAEVVKGQQSLLEKLK